MPIQGDYHVELCDWNNPYDRAALRTVRNTVFVIEQNVPPELELDADDLRATHILARTLDGEPVGAARITPSGRIGRMAVLTGYRRRGIGSSMLHTLLDFAAGRGLRAVRLHSQNSAMGFYARHGFTAEGDEFVEAGIPHRLMRRDLPATEAPERPRHPVPLTPVALRANTREELIGITLSLLAGARHGMCVRVRELHPLLLNDTACLVELRRLAISGRGASIRVLVEDLSRAMREGMRILDLAQRMPDVFELRRPVDLQDLAYPSAFMCVDSGGYLFRPVEADMLTTGSTYAPGRHAELMGLFEEVWLRAEPWPELRALGI